jgi:hypothetical protein
LVLARRPPVGGLPFARSSRLIVRTCRVVTQMRKPTVVTPRLPPAGEKGRDGSLTKSDAKTA